MEAPEQLRVYLLGRFRVERQGIPVELPTRKAESLLAYLSLHPGPHSRLRLATLFWGDVPEASARASLRNALSTLRRELAPRLLQADRRTAGLDHSYPLWVDALEFRAQARRFLDAPTPDASAVDLDLYSDDLLIDCYDDWVLVERDALRALYLEILLELTQQMRSGSEYARAVDLAERVLARDRANEPAHQHLMFCQMALGNRGAALNQYESCRDALRQELDVEPSPATENLRVWIRQAPAEKVPGEASITNLPIPPTDLVGRRRELSEVKTALSSGRLLTLTGAGGSGKTRLAIQAATDLLDSYADGVWWVELATVDDADSLTREVARAVGAPEVPRQATIDALVNFLRPRNLLLVLDDCEHLVAACGALADRLLRECPRLTLLATSRETLDVAGEQVWPVPTLTAPEPPHDRPPGRLLDYEAVRLFVERAGAVDPGFALTDENARSVSEICWRLDGLPLAIELAAARLNVLGAEQIADRLDDAFRLLRAGSRTSLPRHQTLGAAVDWSHDLLSREEQVLLRRLSVFAGGWTLPACEATCAGDGLPEGEVLDVLSRLVNKSLVEVQPRDEAVRYRLLRTIRQYSHRRLMQTRETAGVRDRHLEYFTRLVETANPHLGYMLADAEAEAWSRRIGAEYENVRTAVSWVFESLDRPGPTRSAVVEAGLRLTGNLHWLWFARGRFDEGRGWLGRLLEADVVVSSATRARALLTFGYLACWRGEFPSGRAPLEEALGLFRRLEDGGGVAFSLHGLGFVAMGEGDLAASRSLFEDSLREARAAEDRWLASFASHFLAIVLTYQGRYARATRHFQEGNALIRELGGHKQGLAFSRFHLARIARLLGDHREARSRHAEAMLLFRETADRRGLGYSLAGLALVAIAEGRLARAARLSGAVSSLETMLGSFLEAPLQAEYDRALAGVRSELAPATFTAARAEGRAMSLEEALDYALEVSDG